MLDTPITVVETARFLEDAKPLLSDSEQGRSHPYAPTRVLLAVIAKHPEAIQSTLAQHK